MVQRLPSASHGVLSGGSGLATQTPVPGSQNSPASHGGAAAWQVTLPTNWQPPMPSHWSMVQALLSKSQEVPDGASGKNVHAPVSGSHSEPPSHTPDEGGQNTLPTKRQLPSPSHSSIVQRLPSSSQPEPDGGSSRMSHRPVTGLQPWPASHSPVGSRQGTSPNGMQLPVPSHCSKVHRFLSSSHGVPNGVSG